MAGTFITFEGIDGSGKSTQLRLLSAFLRAGGCDIVVTREPGGTPLGQRLRAALLDAQEHVEALTELLVFAADRAQHVRRLLRPALERKQIVLSDRYADATMAYQGAGRGFPQQLVSELVELATGGLKPELTLLFDLPIEQCMKRTSRRNGRHKTDRLDAEDAAFHRCVRDAYLQIAADEPERVRVIDSSGSVDATHKAVKKVIVPFLQSRGYVLKALTADVSYPNPPG